MFRFSTGLSVMEGNDEDTGCGYLIYEGKSSQKIMTHSPLWSPKNIFDDDRRFWVLNEPGILKAIQKPLPDPFFDLLADDLDKLPAPDLHPTLLNGPKSEAKRLFPQIPAPSQKRYIEFIEFLEEQFGLIQTLTTSSKFCPFSEDIGPCMVGLLNEQYVAFPEWPTLYKAPIEWRRLTWLLNNHFSGPYDADTEAVKSMGGRRFHWGLLKIEESLKNKSTEGLIYFFIAKLILTYQAWMKEEASTSDERSTALDDFIELVQNQGIRPWQYLY